MKLRVLASCRCPQINPSDLVVTEVDIKLAISVNGSKGNRVTLQSATDGKQPPLKVHLPFVLHLADQISRTVFNRRQGFRKGTGTGLIAADRHGHVQSLMRTLPVVYLPPPIKAPLTGRQRGKILIAQHFCLESPMKPLVLALGLRMIGMTVTDANPQADQPQDQGRQGLLALASPGWAVIHEHPFRQTIAPKGRGQGRLHRGSLFIPTRLQTDREAGMVILYRQGMAAALGNGEVAFEV